MTTKADSNVKPAITLTASTKPILVTSTPLPAAPMNSPNAANVVHLWQQLQLTLGRASLHYQPDTSPCVTTLSSAPLPVVTAYCKYSNVGMIVMASPKSNATNDNAFDVTVDLIGTN